MVREGSDRRCPIPMAGTVRQVGPEAMSHGVPVIASGTGGMTDWLEHGRNGLIADPSDKKGFANAIIKLLEDEALPDFIAERPAKRREVSSENYMDKLEKLYFDVLGGQKPMPVPSDKQPV